MKKSILISGLTLIVLSFGCSENNKEATQEAPESDSLEHHSEAHESNEQSTGVALNNGAKWQANPETTMGIQNMQTLVNEYINKASPENKLLAENLEKEFSTIFQKCTMTGEAHNQLHNYLLPLKEKIEKLKEDANMDYVKNIHSYLEEYKNYFQ